MKEKVKELASEALSHITVRSRESGEEYYTVRTNAPFWVLQLVRHAHDGAMSPDDWRYKFIVDSLVSIESGDIAGDKLEPAHYTCSLTNWLASNRYRITFCNAARDEYGLNCNMFGLLQAGQMYELREVFHLVKGYLEDRVLGSMHQGNAKNQEVGTKKEQRNGD